MAYSKPHYSLVAIVQSMTTMVYRMVYSVAQNKLHFSFLDGYTVLYNVLWATVSYTIVQSMTKMCYTMVSFPLWAKVSYTIAQSMTTMGYTMGFTLKHTLQCATVLNDLLCDLQ